MGYYRIGLSNSFNVINHKGPYRVNEGGRRARGRVTRAVADSCWLQKQKGATCHGVRVRADF